MIAEGLESNPNCSVFVKSLLPINYRQQKKIFWRIGPELENNIRYEYIPLINLPLIRNVFSSLYVFLDLIFRRFPSNSQNVILVDYLCFSINLSVALACKIRRIKTLVVATDLPGLGVTGHQTLKARIRNKLIFFSDYDYYLCITEKLNEVLNKKNKPFLIIEGFVNIKFQKIENSLVKKFEERIIIYAGGLYERYGLKSLIEGFMLIPDKDVRLFLYGVGPFINDIVQYSKVDQRIAYKGVIPHADLIGELLRATLLINPRPVSEEFTKYSFPSKNLEYMSTGTPLATTRLPGIPSDHFPYIFLIDDESSEGIYNCLSRILKKSNDEINRFGLVSKKFTLSEKNNVIQAAKIIHLLKSQD